MIGLVFAAVGIVIAFNLGAWYTEHKYKKMIASLKNEKIESETAWSNHCKELRRHYEKALMEKHSNKESEGEE